MKSKLQNNNWMTFLSDNWLMLLIIMLAAWLRFWQLDTHAILFSDAGRDLMVAHQALTDHNIPLLGIPSSVPRFKQGPVSIWIEMIAISLFGVNTLAMSMVFAFLSVAAVIALYEYVCITVGKYQAIIAVLLLAASPLAVANARVPYHTTPLPLALLGYLFSLYGLQKRKPVFYLLSGISFGLLFQFELAVAPLLLLIPFTIWYKKIEINRQLIVSLVLGLMIGVWPQIAYDLTHQFAQLGVFVLWVGHKVLEFVTFKGGGTTTLPLYFENVSSFGIKIISGNNIWLAASILLTILFGSWQAILELRKKSLHFTYLIAYLSFFLLLASYLIHGAPSEAYFPPFFILIPIIISHAVQSLPANRQKVAIGILILLAAANTVTIVTHNYFVSTTNSFNYGPSVFEQRQVLDFINQKSGGKYTLKTDQGYEDLFKNYFDNYRWLALEKNIPTDTAYAKYFYIQNKSDAPLSSEYFYRDFDTIRVWWPISD